MSKDFTKPWRSKYEVWEGHKLLATPHDKAALMRVLSWYPEATVCYRRDVKPIKVRGLKPPKPLRSLGKPELDMLLEKAIAAFKALTPEQQAEHMRLQRESWVRGEAALSRLERGQTRRALEDIGGIS